MSNFTDLQLTQLGKDLQAKVQAGATMMFAHIALGSGTWAPVPDVNAMTELVAQETTIPITEVKVLGNDTYLVQGVIDSDDFTPAGYDHTEVGIYATDPDLGDILYQATNATEPDYIPGSGEGVPYSAVLNFNTTIDDNATVTVVVDNAAAATKSDLAAHEDKMLDPSDTDPVIEKHLSNAQAHQWEADIAANAAAIGVEQNARVAADNSLGDQLNAEAVARVAADSQHAAQQDAHAATAAASPNRMMIRDANARAQVAAPYNIGDIARLYEVQVEAVNRVAHVNATSAHGATEAATPSRMPMRNASGDLFARLFRSEYSVVAPNCNYFMGQVELGTNQDNYVRPMSLEQARALIFQDGFGALLAENGYQRLPSGLIIQWVTGAAVSAQSEAVQTINWPIEFPNAALFALPITQVLDASTGANNVFQLYGNPTPTQVSVYSQQMEGSYVVDIYPKVLGIGH